MAALDVNKIDINKFETIKSRDELASIIKNYFPSNIAVTELELLQLDRIQASRGLRIDQNQLFVIPRGGKLSIETSLHGYRAVADASGFHAGTSDVTYDVRFV